MAVHHVHMNHARPCVFDAAERIAKPSEISRQ
jgi:hypothetical protein